ncbi:MAG: sugar ABC transporter permease, partial [Clostridia bacterium]|nr:sugar ABC transporter permease [Clostridia bacterium]
TRGGTMNEILSIFGVKRIQWFGSRWTGVFAISFAEVWRNVGYAMVISLAGMQSVSSDYLEAARIDGANEWKSYIHVTLPLIMPTVNVNILFSQIYGLKMFDLIFVMTKGGPGGATESFGTLMYNEMGAGRYATSVAVNLIFTVILMVVAVLYKKYSERWEKMV